MAKPYLQWLTLPNADTNVEGCRVLETTAFKWFRQRGTIF